MFLLLGPITVGPIRKIRNFHIECDPPESFVIAQIVAHVVTLSAHRRQLARWMLRQAGVDLAPTLDPDPITWQRQQYGGTP